MVCRWVLGALTLAMSITGHTCYGHSAPQERHPVTRPGKKKKTCGAIGHPIRKQGPFDLNSNPPARRRDCPAETEGSRTLVRIFSFYWVTWREALRYASLTNHGLKSPGSRPTHGRHSRPCLCLPGVARFAVSAQSPLFIEVVNVHVEKVWCA